MQVRVYSDLHLEFNSNFNPGTGDVLVLAGDICVGNDVKDKGVQKFFKRCAEGYNKVFYVLGNHEYYSGDLDKTLGYIRDNIPSDIVLLDNNSVFHNGIHFVGATMWSDFLQQNPQVMDNCKYIMNDYSYISRNGATLIPEDLCEKHLETRAWFDQVLPTLRGDVFMITHHQPSLRSVSNTRYDNEVRGAYCTELSDFIMKHPNVKWWAAGHVHENQDYHIGECNVISNPRGYHPHSLNPGFDPLMALNVSDKQHSSLAS